jgi:hypothetical protein
MNISTTILGQDSKLILWDIKCIKDIESHLHNKKLLDSKEGQKYSLLGMSQQGCNFLLNNNKWRGRDLRWLLMALIIAFYPVNYFLLFFGEIFPNSLHRKIEKNLNNCHPQKEKNNNEWIGKKSMVVLRRFFHKNSRFFQTAN